MDNHDKHFHKKHKHLSLFAVSVDGMIRNEALVILTNLSRIMAEKIEEPIFHVCGWINGRIAIVFKRL